jgi:N-acyl homoserine lactone hydrolase
VIRGLVLAALAALATPAVASPPPVAIWRIDCGATTNIDLDIFDDSGALKGKTKAITNSCYLIRHGKDLMLWDAGFGAELIGHPLTVGAMVVSLPATIVDQLGRAGIAPEAVRYLGISHLHYDHISQAADFPKATLLIAAKDYAILAKGEGAPYIEPQRLSPWIKGGAPKRLVTGDLDVFGDGTVTMIALPGHTPGNSGLLVRRSTGAPVLLSGDMWHVSEEVATNGVPRFNMDRAETVASQKRFAEVAKQAGAITIVQHEPADIDKLPALSKD